MRRKQSSLRFCFVSDANLNSLEHKSICDDDSLQYVQEKGSQSSLVLNLLPDKTKPFCKRQFHAPESHGFYVRLQRIPSPVSTNRKISQQNGMSKKYGSKKSNNITDSCALSIVSKQHCFPISLLFMQFFCIYKVYLAVSTIICSQVTISLPIWDV